MRVNPSDSQRAAFPSKEIWRVERAEEGGMRKEGHTRGDPCCDVSLEAGGQKAHRPTLPSCGTARELHIRGDGDAIAPVQAPLS